MIKESGINHTPQRLQNALLAAVHFFDDEKGLAFAASGKAKIKNNAMYFINPTLN